MAMSSAMRLTSWRGMPKLSAISAVSTPSPMPPSETILEMSASGALLTKSWISPPAILEPDASIIITCPCFFISLSVYVDDLNVWTRSYLTLYANTGSHDHLPTPAMSPILRGLLWYPARLSSVSCRIAAASVRYP